MTSPIHSSLKLPSVKSFQAIFRTLRAQEHADLRPLVTRKVFLRILFGTETLRIHLLDPWLPSCAPFTLTASWELHSVFARSTHAAAVTSALLIRISIHAHLILLIRSLSCYRFVSTTSRLPTRVD